MLLYRRVFRKSFLNKSSSLQQAASCWLEGKEHDVFVKEVTEEGEVTWLSLWFTWELTYPFKDSWEDDFTLPEVAYVSSQEGTSLDFDDFNHFVLNNISDSLWFFYF